ncbi:copper resistance CopC/CopD family protein [Actinomadura latina]|uniref:Copper resistance protein CopC/CopD n=1 Tax=Actinomadura latina TaxID=163603 RepID=A0A846YW69_9ACTN|nr:copper resistance protein CopC [Actinomadura latina]NKZ02922.1 copper resistance protein CopC/CopD [Actinomadura latina]
MNHRLTLRLVTLALALIVPALIAPVFLAGPADAHTMLRSSSPADGEVVTGTPARVILTFTEPVRPVTGGIRVLGPAGQDVGGAVSAEGSGVTVAVRPPADADAVQGTYTVSWRVVSADSHPVAGAFTFAVGHPSAAQAGGVRGDGSAADLPDGARTVPVLRSVARFLGYAGFAMLAGAAAFCAYAFSGGPELRGLRRVMAAGWAALVAGALGALLLHAPYINGTSLASAFRPASLRETVLDPAGRALVVQAAIAVVSPLLLYRAWAGLPGSRAKERLVFGVCAAVAACALAVTWPLSGHAVAGPRPLLTTVAGTAHVCAMGLWVGGLAALAVTVRARAGDPAAGTAAARFSWVAAGSVAVLALTGLHQARLRVETPEALTTTGYGVTLLVKLALVAGVVAVAFFSRRVLQRRKSAAVPVRLGRLVAVETAGTLAVIMVTAPLVSMQPAGTAFAAKPVTLTAGFDTGGAEGSGTLAIRMPNRARGLTDSVVRVRDGSGRPKDVAELTIAWSQPDRRIGPIDARVDRLAAGRYSARTPPLTAAGRWLISVTVRTGEIDQAKVRLAHTLR